MGKVKNTYIVEFLLQYMKLKKNLWVHEGVVKTGF